MSPQNLRSTAVAALAALSLLISVSVLANLKKEDKKSPPPPPRKNNEISGQLATVRQARILVNGKSTPSGATIFSGSNIQTPESIGAAILIGSLGRVDTAPKTTLTLTFAEGMIEVDLISGCAMLSTEVGTKGLVKTPQEVNHSIGPDKRAFTDICTGDPEAAAPIIDEGAAAKAGAGVCWAVTPPVVTHETLSPLWLFTGGPIVGAGIVSTDGRPDTISASSPAR